METGETSLPPRVRAIDFDYTAPRSEEGSNAMWRALRAQYPVAWTEHHGGHWVISTYAQNVAAFRDWETFSSARTDPRNLSIQIIGGEIGILNPEELDPPEWDSYRHVLARLLSPGAVQRLRPRVEKWVRYYIDEAIESGTIDLAYDLSSRVPGAVVLDWLGWPRDEWDRVSHAWHAYAGHAPGMPEFDHAIRELGWVDGRIVELVADRQKAPRDDAISSFVTTEIDGRPMSAAYAEGMVRLAVAGGVETTTAVTSAALVHLHFNPQHRQALLDDPKAFDLAIEEFLRVHPPARTHARTLTKDVEFGGCPMRKGDRVLLSEVSANYDESVFPDADKFVIDRFPNRHVAFGMGIHRCPGSHLARLEMRETISQVLTRMPDYEVIEDKLVAAPNWGSAGGWVRAPAVFTPGRRTGASAE